MRRTACFPVLIMLLVGYILCTPAGATAIEITPAQIDPGDSINVIIRDLADGAEFLMVAEAITGTDPGPETAFIMRNFSLPFSLLDGEIGAVTGNTAWVEFAVTKKGTTARVESSPENGTFSTAQTHNITAGLYDSILLQAEPFSEDIPVQTTITIAGRKSGPDDAEMSFTAEGIDAGRLRVTILVDDELIVNTDIAIGDITGNAEGPFITSADGLLTLEAGENISSAFVDTGTPKSLPEGWEAVSAAYTLMPSNLTFPSGGILTFTISGDAATDPDHSTLSFVQQRDGGWEILPSRILPGDGERILAATIASSGTFAVVDLADVGCTEAPHKRSATALPGFIPITTLAGLLIGYLIIPCKQNEGKAGDR